LPRIGALCGEEAEGLTSPERTLNLHPLLSDHLILWIFVKLSIFQIKSPDRILSRFLSPIDYHLIMGYYSTTTCN